MKIITARIATIVGLSTALVLACQHQAEALSFNLSYDTNLANYAYLDKVKAATQAVANNYQNLFSDDVIVNVNVAAMSTGLGQSSTHAFLYDYTTLKAALDPKLVLSQIALLPVTDPTGSGTGTTPMPTSFFVATAQAKELGLLAPSSAVDGTFSFNTSQSFSFDRSVGVAPSTYDFMGVAEHEFSEIMGRISILKTQSNYDTSYDLFRFMGLGVRSFDPTATGVYFSTDNGATALKTFNSAGGGDTADWNTSNPYIADAYNAFLPSGVAVQTTPTDIVAMQSLGWQSQSTIVQSQSTAVPEPSDILSTLIVMALGAKMVIKHKKLLATNTIQPPEK